MVLFSLCFFLLGAEVEAGQADIMEEAVLEVAAAAVEVLAAAGVALAAAGVQETGRMQRDNNFRGPGQ